MYWIKKKYSNFKLLFSLFRYFRFYFWLPFKAISFQPASQKYYHSANTSFLDNKKLKANFLVLHLIQYLLSIFKSKVLLILCSARFIVLSREKKRRWQRVLNAKKTRFQWYNFSGDKNGKNHVFGTFLRFFNKWRYYFFIFFSKVKNMNVHFFAVFLNGFFEGVVFTVFWPFSSREKLYHFY